jgi:maleate isomerase
MMLVALRHGPRERGGNTNMPRHFGMLIPSTNTTCEIEFCRLPADLQVHTGRLGKGGNTPFSPSLDADVVYQSRLLGDARVEVIALMQTSASLFADDYDALTVKRMTEASGVPSLTSAQAIGRALRALGTLRVAMATPYSQDVIARARRYYEENYGIAVMATESLGATNSYAIGKMDANAAQAAFKRIDRPEIEALVVPSPRQCRATDVFWRKCPRAKAHRARGRVNERLGTVNAPKKLPTRDEKSSVLG